eukprot:3846034-Amphidinium_carterae.2
MLSPTSNLVQLTLPALHHHCTDHFFNGQATTTTNLADWVSAIYDAASTHPLPSIRQEARLVADGVSLAIM